MKISDDIFQIGVNDHDIDLFEGQYKVPYGMAYNSYLIMDEKVAIMDTVDKNFTTEWLNNIQKTLNDKTPDYLIVQHMEMDHSSNIMNLLNVYPNIKVVGNIKTFSMIKQLFNIDINNKIVVNDGDTISLGKHLLQFIFAPMVHWPEVMITYDNYNQVLFSADAFGKFGALDIKQDWIDEARRYYIGIVGKYGLQVQSLLKKVSKLEINTICSLHGPILNNNLSYYISLYDKWSSYLIEEEGITIAYTSIYGNTKAAAILLEEKLKARGYKNVISFDLARDDIHEAIATSFRFSKLVLASPTYNTGLFPMMSYFIDGLVERNFQKRSIAIIENGTWAPMAARIIKDKLSKCKDLTFIEPIVTLKTAINNSSEKDIETLCDNLCDDLSY